MGTIKHIFQGLGLICCIWLQAGCTEVLVPGAFTGAGEYYRYTTTNVAEKTLMGTVSQITAASRDALKKMNIQLHAVHSGDSETEVTASGGKNTFLKPLLIIFQIFMIKG